MAAAAAVSASASASLSMSMAAAGQLPVPRAVKAPALSLSLWTRPLRADLCKCKCRCLVIGGGIGFARARKFGAGFAVFAQDSAVAADAIEDQGIASDLSPNEEADESFQSSFDAFQAHDEGAEFSQEFSSPPPDTRLYVGNIPFEIDSEALANLFQEAGVVETAEVIYDRATGRSKGFGFVSMSTAEEAKEAINKFNGSQVSGRVLKVNISEVRKGVRKPPIFGVDTAFKVFVGNLPWSADADMLKEAFNRCGNVVGAKVLYDRDTGRSRGFGFVSFSSQAEVDSAVTEMNGVDVGGRPIRVDIPRSAITPVSGPDSESPAAGQEDL